MKTRIITLITFLAVVLGISVSDAAPLKNINGTQQPVVLPTNNINKIEAWGNVEIYIASGDKDEVKVYDKYYTENALVQNKDGVLRIASYNADKLVVLVTVTDLRTITAFDNAAIKSYGRLALINLNLVLNNHASAQLNFDAIAAKVTLNNRATADISGSVVDYESARGQSSTLNKTKLTAVNIIEHNITNTTRQSEVASL